MKVLKKTFAVAAAVSLVCLSSVGAMAAQKLIVKDSTGTNDVFVVTDSGSIGIGTSAPAAAFHLVGTSINTTQFRSVMSGTTASDSSSFLFLRNNPSGTNSLPLLGNKLGVFYFGAMDGSTVRIGSSILSYASGNWSSTSTPTYIAFTTTPSGSAAATERMRIDMNGNLGVGTNNPTQRLDVSGGIRINSTETQPTCNSGIRGTFWITQGTTDVLEVCAQVSGGYAWHPITLN